ncbi:L,D-transpeptidase family protein [Bacillus sp. PS06]|uniref:L,D-transpeptidase family protein n=1 Tax=Bacillus sp. PS06 TaxID=2764176 RepID=UPI00177F1F7B|nr:L,D-transpeptidase family protein [Bacillus sp. PS06]MBD8070133.1 L,D-transpeptidase family protein [Bacillus sp. PS06]
MANTAKQRMEQTTLSRKQQVKWYKNWKYISLITISLIILVIGSMSYYQYTHFNENKTINGIEVSGLSANKALTKLQSSKLKNEIYIGEELVVTGKETQMGFTDADLPEIKKLLKNQWTFFPSFDSKEYSIMPSIEDDYRSNELKSELEQKLISLNLDLKAPIDATARIEDGKVVISEGSPGEQFDVNQLIKEYETHEYVSDIHLDPIYREPVMKDDEVVLNQEKQLQEFLQHTVEYKVQDEVFPLKASDLITKASLTEDLEIVIEADKIEKKMTEINHDKSTLGKDFTFKTHSGKSIQVKGKGYGWALDVEKETAQILAAFEKGEKSLAASNIYGNGWSGEGYGYDTTSNNGIGNTYAEVSIKEQRIWIYRDGKLVVSTDVVTGKHSTGEDTSPGVWYILYKRTPYTLTGSAVGNPNYSIDVDYWAPFTNSGQGFHDASWRTNWSKNAYLTQGSGGCVNVPPNVMKSIYDNLRTYDPVIVY